ncbi:phosphotransferase family protein [Celeribacter indicus]|uniref:Aminoglycoside phosphotransferase n=1 Tax=Celeribacter indicus TaxID=1208324 RepID=A0A0B5DX16_9RHOB|nr:phosphotransferase [Celeribacter indicus]AJE47564.1 aminoglycoside phosphotransferase [Celeribacter indicus]SDW10333.1 Thiamine kinase [Celeribacter indicus]
MSVLVDDAMMAEAVRAAGLSMEGATDGPAALASPSYRALESRSVLTGGAFVKRMHPEMRDGFDLGAAMACATMAGEAGAGPRVIWSDAGMGAIAMEALGPGWITLRQDGLQRPEVVEGAMAAMRRLHAGPEIPSRFDPFAQIDRLIAAFGAEGVARPDDILWLRRVIGMAEGLAEGVVPAPCRNDGSASNLMAGPEGQVMLVDFDRAGMNDPLYDVGCLLAEVTDHERDMRAGYIAYAGAFDEAGFARARLWSHVDDMLHALWARLMAHRSERRSVEWIKYGEWRLLRLRIALSHPLYEEKIRLTGEAA